MEETIDPDLVICDPHHHLWNRPGSRYLLEDLTADTGSGHRVLRTVFVECMSGYRTDGPEAFPMLVRNHDAERVCGCADHQVRMRERISHRSKDTRRVRLRAFQRPLFSSSTPPTLMRGISLAQTRRT